MGIILVIYASLNLNITITVASLFWFIISIFFGAMIYMAIKVFLATNTFFIKDAYQLLFLGYNFSDFVKYPLEIYNKPIRMVLSYIIPFGFTAFIPASYFLQTATLRNTIIIEIFVGVIAFAVAYKYFCFGCNRYESAGN